MLANNPYSSEKNIPQPQQTSTSTFGYIEPEYRKPHVLVYQFEGYENQTIIEVWYR